MRKSWLMVLGVILALLLLSCSEGKPEVESQIVIEKEENELLPIDREKALDTVKKAYGAYNGLMASFEQTPVRENQVPYVRVKGFQTQAELADHLLLTMTESVVARLLRFYNVEETAEGLRMPMDYRVRRLEPDFEKRSWLDGDRLLITVVDGYGESVGIVHEFVATEEGHRLKSTPGVGALTYLPARELWMVESALFDQSLDLRYPTFYDTLWRPFEPLNQWLLTVVDATYRQGQKAQRAGEILWGEMSVEFVKDAFIAVETHSYYHYRQANRPKREVVGVTLDTKTGEVLTLEEVFLTDEAHQPIMVTWMMEEVSQRPGYFTVDEELFFSGLESWVVTEYGIKVIYPSEVLAPYAYGTPSFVIPYDRLQTTLSETFKERMGL